MDDRRWKDKFADAFRGVGIAVRGESSFVVHFIMSAAVLVAAFLLRATLLEGCVLLLCITIVLAAETVNSAMENFARAITSEHNEHIGRGLDAAAGAVLICSIGSALVGGLIFLNLLAIRLGYAIANTTP